MPGKIYTIEWLDRFEKRHRNKFDYSHLKEIKDKVSFKLTCPKHGEFETTPYKHWKYDCKRCASEGAALQTRLTTENVIERSKAAHGDRYDYSKTKYISQDHKIEIICKEHGSFWIGFHNHVDNDSGCPKCANLNKGHKNKNLKGKDWLLYFLKFKNKKEQFLKIGTRSLKERYRPAHLLGYSYDVLSEKKLEYLEACNIEQKIKQTYKKYHYTPLNESFDGKTECFIDSSEVSGSITKNYFGKETYVNARKSFRING